MYSIQFRRVFLFNTIIYRQEFSFCLHQKAQINYKIPYIGRPIIEKIDTLVDLEHLGFVWVQFFLLMSEIHTCNRHSAYFLREYIMYCVRLYIMYLYSHSYLAWDRVCTADWMARIHCRCLPKASHWHHWDSELVSSIL